MQVQLYNDILFDQFILFLTVAEAPKVDLSSLGGREIRLRAGEPLKIDVPISGSPTPTISWQKDGKNLAESPRVCLNVLRILELNAPFLKYIGSLE